MGGSGAPALSRVDMSFIKGAVRELLRCRRVLKASYCYGYYLQGLLSTKKFEYMQVQCSIGRPYMVMCPGSNLRGVEVLFLILDFRATDIGKGMLMVFMAE